MAIPLASMLLLSGFQAAPGGDAQFATLVRTWLSIGQPADWNGLDGLPGSRWAPLPPTSLQNCLPDGGCFARQGSAMLGGRSVAMVASGARTMVMHLYFRNSAAPLGEAAVVAALAQAGFTTELARCPVRGGAGSTNWHRLRGANLASAYLAIQMTRGATPTEGFILSTGDDLPALQPNQLALYSTQCAAGAEQRPVATQLPHQRVAEVITSLLVPAAASQLTWQALAAVPTGIEWAAGGPKPVDYSTLGDANPVSLSGNATWSERRFSARASGTATQVRSIFLEEGGQHPRGEHMLGVVYEKGIAVRLVRCGPVYSESTNNWYSLTSTRTRPAMIRQSIHYDGNQVADTYELRLDGSLPARDPRDRNPGVNGCA